MATHSSIFAWRIPRAEAGRLQSMGLQKWDTNKATWHAHNANSAFMVTEFSLSVGHVDW